MDPDKINAEVYRCQKSVAPAVTAAAVPGDPTAIQNVLLGTWSGTLSNRSAPTRSPSQPNQVRATVRVANEGGQLRWNLEVGDSDLNGSGTVTHFFGDVTLTGTYGPGALPITYSLKLGGETLQGTGVGPDQILRTLSLRKQP